jgi:hypothetical protein
MRRKGEGSRREQAADGRGFDREDPSLSWFWFYLTAEGPVSPSL